jgi:hypothetical protein
VLPSHGFTETGSARNRKNLPLPVQRCRTRWLCRLRMVPLTDRRSSRCFAPWGRLLLLITSNSRMLYFQTSNNRTQPASNRLFDNVKFHNFQDVAVILLHIESLRQLKIC